jgi:hypothetical protein
MKVCKETIGPSCIRRLRGHSIRGAKKSEVDRLLAVIDLFVEEQIGQEEICGASEEAQSKAICTRKKNRQAPKKRKSG